MTFENCKNSIKLSQGFHNFVHFLGNFGPWE